jgi:addiction module antidote protein HigA
MLVGASLTGFLRPMLGGVKACCGKGKELMSVVTVAPIHPGEVLMEDFIEGFGITQHKLAVAIGVPPRRINEIVHGKRGITADTAMRLSRYFGTTPGFWMNLQMRYELDRAEDALGDTLSGIVPLATVEVACINSV